MGPCINFAVFPMGQDYHLPHHLYATVPHYRLRQLHEFLLRVPGVPGAGGGRSTATSSPPDRPQAHPTVLDVLGPDYAAARHTAASTSTTACWRGTNSRAARSWNAKPANCNAGHPR